MHLYVRVCGRMHADVRMQLSVCMRPGDDPRTSVQIGAFGVIYALTKKWYSSYYRERAPVMATQRICPRTFYLETRDSWISQCSEAATAVANVPSATPAIASATSLAPSPGDRRLAAYVPGTCETRPPRLMAVGGAELDVAISAAHSGVPAPACEGRCCHAPRPAAVRRSSPKRAQSSRSQSARVARIPSAKG